MRKRRVFNDDWNYIKQLYVTKLHCPPRVVDYIAVESILKYCAEGNSNSSISNFTEIDIEDIIFVLEEFLKFKGWIQDLDLNPLAIYERLSGDYEKFFEEVAILSPASSKRSINRSFNICRDYKKIRKEVDKFYYDN